jgi:hypothetical protein
MPDAKEKDQKREDFQQGREDGKKGPLGRLIADLPGNHPNNEAYYAGRKSGRRTQKPSDKTPPEL